MYEYKGYIKITEKFTGEVVLGPKSSVDNWVSSIKEDFSDVELRFHQLKLNKDDCAFVNNL